MSSASSLRQPRLRVSLLPVGIDQVDTLGVIGLSCRATLRVETGSGRPPVPVRFVVDSGSSYTMIGLEMADRLDLPVPLPDVETDLLVTGIGGTSAVRVRPGRVRAWWTEDRRGYPFDWPVLFRVDAPLTVPPILGLGGVVKTCRWTIDGGYSPHSPYGYLNLDDVR